MNINTLLLLIENTPVVNMNIENFQNVSIGTFEWGYYSRESSAFLRLILAPASLL